jgi:hypothetical protein
MKPLEQLTANKWYPMQANGKSLYPTPQSILRRAVGAEEYKFVSETVTTDHIRAAVIMPLDVPFQHLLIDVPWGMSFKTDAWRMLIVSVVNPTRWLELARASGAKAWLKGHNQTMTYNWEPPEVDEHGLKKRPGNALGVTRIPEPGVRVTKKKGKQVKDYNLEDLLSDCKMDDLTHTEIGAKHGLSRITVMKIAREHGIIRRGPHHGQSYVKT